MPDPSLPFEGYLSKKILVWCLTYFSTAHLKRRKYTKGEDSDSKQCRNVWPKGLQSKPAVGKSTLSFSFITQRKNKQLEAKPFDARVTEFTFKPRFSQHHDANVTVQSLPAIAKTSLSVRLPATDRQEVPDVLLRYKHNLRPPTKWSTYVESLKSNCLLVLSQGLDFDL